MPFSQPHEVLSSPGRVSQRCWRSSKECERLWSEQEIPALSGLESGSYVLVCLALLGLEFLHSLDDFYADVHCI